MRDKRQFDFVRRWELAERKHTTGRLTPKKTGLVIFGLFLLCGLGALPWTWAYKQEIDLQKVNDQIKALSAIDIQVNKLAVLRGQINSQQQLLREIQSGTADPGPVLDKLRALLPAGTTVTTFSMQADKSVTLEVNVPTPVDVARLLTSIQSSGYFLGSDIKTVSLQDKSQSLALALKLK